MGRILVVDDQATQRKKIELAVSGLGYDVETTASAAQAISHLKHNPVDMILLDIEMPEADGFSVLNWLSQQPAFKHIPVIVISAHESDRSQVIKAIQMGANDFLPKNFPRPVLQARIKAGLLVKKNHDAEIEMTHQIERLTRASELLENSIYNPKQLQLNTIASGASSMANFASVFSDMAQKIYDRERRLKHAAQTIRGFGLLLLTGLLFGLEAPIAKWKPIRSQFHWHGDLVECGHSSFNHTNSNIQKGPPQTQPQCHQLFPVVGILHRHTWRFSATEGIRTY